MTDATEPLGSHVDHARTDAVSLTVNGKPVTLEGKGDKPPVARPA